MNTQAIDSQHFDSNAIIKGLELYVIAAHQIVSFGDAIETTSDGDNLWSYFHPIPMCC